MTPYTAGQGQMVDWDLALSTARKLVKPGPTISRTGARQAVEELRVAAARAESYVEQVTGLTAESATAPVLVVDRPGWIQANVDAFSQILEPLTAKLGERVTGSAFAPVGARLSGAEVGALLSYLAPKVLGQFDPFFPGGPGEPGGRLLLVAPNVVTVERELRLDPSDFRLWVCLHEETHRVQFTAVPWLRDHLNAQIAAVVDGTEVDAAALTKMIKNAAGAIGEAMRGEREISIVDLVQTPAQRAVVEHITAVMSLLEGHADVVMDSVGPDVVPSVATIRARFDERRQGRGPDKIIRKLLGLDAKMRQYRDGARFCREVIGAVGMDGFNRVWLAPQTLPTPQEIAEPASWVDRVASDLRPALPSEPSEPSSSGSSDPSAPPTDPAA